jgi:hypothetical protein
MVRKNSAPDGPVCRGGNHKITGSTRWRGRPYLAICRGPMPMYQLGELLCVMHSSAAVGALSLQRKHSVKSLVYLAHK